MATKQTNNVVSKVVATRVFKNSVKRLKKKHNDKVLEELYTAVRQLINLEISTQKKNHTLKNFDGHKDLHLDGGRLILLYRYDVEEDTLILTLKLQDIVDHKQLNDYDRRKLKAPVEKYDIDQILSNTQHENFDLSYDDFMAWYEELIDEDQWVVDELADIYNIPLYKDATSDELVWLKDEFLASRNLIVI